MKTKKREKFNNEYYREYYKKNKLKIKEIVKKWSIKNNKKVKAHWDIEYAIKKGKIIKNSCEICGFKNVDGHHPDYNKPLEVIWLCRKHHKEIHKSYKLKK